MKNIPKQDEVDFDIRKAQKSLLSYSRSVGIRSMMIDTSGTIIYDTQSDNGVCKLCQMIQRVSNCSLNCSKVWLYGSYQAERFGGKYIFFCPMGLVYWACPITQDGIMKASILSGPITMVEPEEFLLDEIIARHQIQDHQIYELKQCIAQMPIIQPDIVTDMSELLFMVATHISDTKHSAYMHQREQQEQEADISQYIHHIKTMGGGSEEEITPYPLEKEKALLSLIAMGDKSGSQELLNEILGYIFFSTGRNFEMIKARVLEMIVLLSRAALEGGADVEQIFGLNYKYINQIHSFKTVEDLAHWLSKIMIRFTDCVFDLTDVKHVDVIYKAIDHIKRNYMEKITLEEVASHVYLSSSYFSKIFKEEMKVNFNTYLNNIRIEMAKKLLLDDSIALVDVSNLVGFEDQSYFSKVFKKLTGATPGKFRESRGKR